MEEERRLQVNNIRCIHITRKRFACCTNAILVIVMVYGYRCVLFARRKIPCTIITVRAHTLLQQVGLLRVADAAI